MPKSIPKFKRGEYEERYNALPNSEKEVLDDYERLCLTSANESKALDMKRNILKFLLTIGKPTTKIELKDLENFIIILDKASNSDYFKNDMKVHVKKFIKRNFKDWSERFDNLDCIKQNTNPIRKREIDENTLTKGDVEKLVKTENKTFWKAFVMCQYEGALRTKEVRFLKWDDLKSEGEFYTTTLYSTKNKKKKPIVFKGAKFYLDKLRQEQKNSENIGKYIFHSKKDINKPIDKATVSLWMRKLSRKALGREVFCYTLRHLRGTELARLVKKGKVSKDNALSMMGHTEKMFDKVYSHVTQDEIKNMLKKQVYNIEDLPPERKHKLELEVEELKKLHEKEKKERENIAKMMKVLMKRIKN